MTTTTDATQQIEAAIKTLASNGAVGFDEIINEVGLVDAAEFKATLLALRADGTIRLVEYTGAPYLVPQIDTYGWDLTGYGDLAWWVELC